MNGIRLLTVPDGKEAGTISIKDNKINFNIKDKTIEQKIKNIAEKPIKYLKDEELDYAEKTVMATAEPGTEEHLKALLFELREIGLEGRVINWED